MSLTTPQFSEWSGHVIRVGAEWGEGPYLTLDLGGQSEGGAAPEVRGHSDKSDNSGSDPAVLAEDQEVTRISE